MPATRANLRLFRLPVDCYSDVSLLWGSSTGHLRDEYLQDEYLTVLKTTEPPTRKAGIKVTSVDELVGKLRNEAGVLS